MEQFEKHEGTVIGLSRRGPDFAARAEWIQLDLTGAQACRERLAPLAGRVTHLVYTALHEER